MYNFGNSLIVFMDQTHPAPQAPQTPSSPHKKGDSTTLILVIVGMIVFGVVAVAIIGALVAYVLTQTVSTIVEEADINGIVDVIEEEIDEEADIDNGETVIDETSGVLSVNWTPVSQQTLSSPEVWATPLVLDLRGSDARKGYYEVGTITSGNYQGYALRIMVAEVGGLGPNYVFPYLADPKQITKPIILDAYGSFVGAFADGVYQSTRQLFGEDLEARLGDSVVYNTRLSVPELDIETRMKDSSGKSFEFIGLGTVIDSRPTDEIIFGETNDGYTIYTSKSFYPDSFYTIREDGRVVKYALDIPFWSDESELIGKPTFNWPNGWPTAVYAKGRIGGCGFSSPIAFVEDINVVGELRATTVSSGHTIYLPEDLTNEYFSEKFNDWVYSDESSFEDFADVLPFFYWKDQTGRWLEFANVDVVPQGECGKPVIYLYPEETMDVDVTVEPRGGFTFTEPAYNDGWSVTAKPNGQLTNKADGKTYPYLFWEGRGGLYQAPEEFWVVEQKEVKRFLKTTLAQYGLNRQEIADFNEFWVPRMKEAEYYKIGFHGTAVMDEIAPLTVSGGPDSIFRILMDFDELEAPVEANPPKKIVPFVREGFTVVEWGGVIE